MVKPLAIDLFCGLGGWTEGLIKAGYFVVGFDIERHEYDGERYPASLVIQDVLTLHGSQFKDGTLIVASPPCQEYSYMAMPFSRGKAKAAAIRADETGAAKERLNCLFNACFRIQREASQAAGRHIPMVVENVRGAIPWVGRARWNFGSYYLWGDVPALMPVPFDALKFNTDGSNHGAGSWFGKADSKNRGVRSLGVKVPSSDGSNRTAIGRGNRFTSIAKIEAAEGRKGAGAGAGAGAEWFDQNLCSLSSKSLSRKAASARVAKIPLALSEHIGRAFLPEDQRW